MTELAKYILQQTVPSAVLRRFYFPVSFYQACKSNCKKRCFWLAPFQCQILGMVICVSQCTASILNLFFGNGGRVATVNSKPPRLVTNSISVEVQLDRKVTVKCAHYIQQNCPLFVFGDTSAYCRDNTNKFLFLSAPRGTTGPAS